MIETREARQCAVRPGCALRTGNSLRALRTRRAGNSLRTLCASAEFVIAGDVDQQIRGRRRRTEGVEQDLDRPGILTDRRQLHRHRVGHGATFGDVQIRGGRRAGRVTGTHHQKPGGRCIDHRHRHRHRRRPDRHHRSDDRENLLHAGHDGTQAHVTSRVDHPHRCHRHEQASRRRASVRPHHRQPTEPDERRHHHTDDDPAHTLQHGNTPSAHGTTRAGRVDRVVPNNTSARRHVWTSRDGTMTV